MIEQDVMRKLLPDGWNELDFEPFREGVEIFWIYKESPQVALLRYKPGARVPRHKHVGLETIFVLEGDQVDDNGTAFKGDFVINYPGSEHSVTSESGCTVLISWEKPVEFLD